MQWYLSKKCLLGIGPRYPLRSIRSSSIDVSVVTISLIVLLQQTISGVGISYPVSSVPRAQQQNQHSPVIPLFRKQRTPKVREYMKLSQQNPADHIEASSIWNSLCLFLSL